MNSDYIPGLTTAAPTATVNPVLSPTSNVFIGTVLSVTDGSWTGTPTSFRYQWRRDAADIAGATSSSYTVVTADHNSSITCRVWASNISGESAFAGSNGTATLVLVLGTPTVPVAAAAANDAIPTSGAYNPIANSLLMVAIEQRGNVVMVAPTLTNNRSLTMSLLCSATRLPDPGTGTRIMQNVWGVVLGSSPPTGLTFSISASTTGHRYVIHQVIIPNANQLPASNEAISMYTASNPSLTFDHTPAVDSTLIGIFGGSIAADTPLAVPTNFTELEDVWPTDGQLQSEICYDANNGAITNGFAAGAYNIVCGAFIEVKRPS